MIKLIKRKKLDVAKYDDCIANSIQSNIFGYSWYLDIVCDNWSVFVLNDYEAVMPIPWRRKYFIKYTYQPFWTIQLGIYSKEIEDEDEFLIELFGEFKYVNLRMNFKNSFSMFDKYCHEKTIQEISFVGNSYERILKSYNRNRKRELKKAQQSELSEHWNESPKLLIDLFRDNVGKRVSKIDEKEYMKLFELMHRCISKGVGEFLTIRDKNNKLVSGAFFLKDNDKVIELVCSSDFKNRENGANTFMNDRAIFKYSSQFKIFNFGGSSMENIAKYYRSFGGENKYYMELKCNNLPWLLRLFKR